MTISRTVFGLPQDVPVPIGAELSRLAQLLPLLLGVLPNTRTLGLGCAKLTILFPGTAASSTMPDGNDA